MGSRNSRQCRERWCNYLNPELRTEAWTSEEDKLLEEKFMEFGGKWNTIAQFFNGRSDLAIRNRMQVLERRTAKRRTKVNETASEELSEARTEAAPEDDPISLNPITSFESLEPDIDFFAENVPDPWGPLEM
jgi:hypothetical protein